MASKTQMAAVLMFVAAGVALVAAAVFALLPVGR
jgi:hypothetical protein